jgi:hypothetical protein
LGAYLVLAASCPWRGEAATNLVYNNNDSAAGSLRQVIHDSSSGDTIIFSNIVTGTITLTNGELAISNKTLTILGPGANVLAVSGNNASRVFNINSSSIISISGLSIRDGAGVFSGGGISCSNSALTLANCAIFNNRAYNGGGIALVGGTAAMNNCTISGNRGTNVGGGIGLIAGGPNLALTNCTLASNTGAPGAGIYANSGQATATIRSCTISSNSAFISSVGGIFWASSGAVDIGNSIVAGNTASFCDPDCYGNVTSAGYNLIGNTNGSSGFGATGDQLNVNPLLGPLQDNGGPTLTMAPLPGSLAIDQGKSFGATTDQRGRPRPFDIPIIPNAIGGDGSDIGAVEINPTQRLVINTNDSGFGSLRQATLDASAGDDDVISFAPGLGGTITLSSGELEIGKSLSITGPGASVLGVSGNSSGRVFDVTNGVVNISGLTIRDGKVLGATGRPGQTVFGGGIYCGQQATLSLSDCVVSNCAAIGGNGSSTIGSGNGGNGGTGYGGGILNYGALTLNRCWVVNNQAAGGGGGSGGIIAGSQGGNGGIGFAGGIYSGSANLTLRACALTGNRATFGSGGGGSTAGANGTAWAAGLDNDGGTAALINSTVASNVVNGAGTGLGGGVYSASGMALLSCTVAGNNGDSSGGGLYGGGTWSVTNTIIANNSAASAPDVSASVASGGYNLIGNTSGSTGFGAAGDQLNVSPALGPLQDNGGPTPTMALSRSSPAVDKGKSFGLSTDQRGAPRPFDFPVTANASGGDGSDIGAFELGGPTLNIQRTGNSVALSWSTSFADFHLQAITDLASSNWAGVSGTQATIGGQFYLTNSALGSKTFYRLISP